MRKAAFLSAVVIDGNRATLEGGFDEARNDHAIVADLTGADDVEEASDDDVEFAFFVIGEGEEFVDGFGAAIGPTGA